MTTLVENGHIWEYTADGFHIHTDEECKNCGMTFGYYTTQLKRKGFCIKYKKRYKGE